MKGRTVLCLVLAINFVIVGMNSAFASERHKRKPDPVIVKNGLEEPVPVAIQQHGNRERVIGSVNISILADPTRTVRFLQRSGGTSFDEIPDGKMLVVTDIIMASIDENALGIDIGYGDATQCSFNLNLHLARANTVIINLQTGIEFLQGEQVCVNFSSKDGGAAVQGVTLIGFVTDAVN